MNITDLIQRLEQLKQDRGGEAVVKVSSDEEGNMISDIFEIALYEDDDEDEIVIFPN